MLARNGDMGACCVGVAQQWRHECVGWELIIHGDGVCIVWVLISHGDGMCVVGADHHWR